MPLLYFPEFQSKITLIFSNEFFAAPRMQINNINIFQIDFDFEQIT